MTTVIVIAVIIIALALITLGLAVRSAANKRNQEASKLAIREAKARTEHFQSYIADDLSRTSRVRRGTPVRYTPANQVVPMKPKPKRQESTSTYYGDETIAYEAPTFGYVDSSPSYNYSDDSSSSSSSSSSYDSGSSYGSSSSSSYDSGSSSSSSDSGSSW